MATNTHPGFTRRESYPTLLTPGSPLCARTSAPSSTCWKVIAQNYMARGQRDKQSPIDDSGWLIEKIGERSYQRHVPEAHSPRQISLRTMRNARSGVRVRQVLLSLPNCAGSPHLPGWPDVLQPLPHRLRLQDLGLTGRIMCRQQPGSLVQITTASLYS